MTDLYAYAHDYDSRKEKIMKTSEQAFFAWYDRIVEAGMLDHYNLRQAFDAGYHAAREEDDK